MSSAAPKWALTCRIAFARSAATSSPKFAARGLWVGVEIDPTAVSARTVCDALLAEGVLSKDTHGTVLRFAPPLTITRDEIDWGMERVERVFSRAIH